MKVGWLLYLIVGQDYLADLFKCSSTNVLIIEFSMDPFHPGTPLSPFAFNFEFAIHVRQKWYTHKTDLSNAQVQPPARRSEAEAGRADRTCC